MRTDDFQRKAYYHQFMLYSLIKPLLFSLSPEKAHDSVLGLAKLSPTLGKISGFTPDPKLSIKVGSVEWKSSVALAAGLDKNAEALSFFANQGFGAIECGTITLRPQVGNPKPRMWRYPEDKSLRNAMGFPNHGLLEILPRLKTYSDSTPIGANIGKNKDSTPEESIEELSILMETLHDHVNYFVINVSSPNTPGLRALQEKSYLTELFQELKHTRHGKDLYLKIAPDLEERKIIELAHLVHEHKLTGMIATNTTIIPEKGMGGVSGELLTQKSRLVRQTILKEKLPIELIGVGGISSSKELFDFWKDGGKAAQIYTAYVYQGAGVLKNIQKDIQKMLKAHELKTLSDFFNLDLMDRKKILDHYPG